MPPLSTYPARPTAKNPIPLMNRSFLALAFTFLTFGLLADGGFSAKNLFGAADKRYVRDVDGVTPLNKTTGRFEILSGGIVISPVTDGTGNTFAVDGIFALGIVNIPGTSGGGSALVNIRAWDNQFGTTFADAVASGGHFGEFQVLVTGLGEGISPPAADAFEGFRSFALNTANLQPLGTVSTTIAGQGLVQVSPSKQYYEPSEFVGFTATPFPGWAFAGWSGGIVSANLILNLHVTAPLSLTATFKPLHTLTLTQVGQGTVTPNPVGPYAEGTSISISATPATGWSFVGWQGDASGNANPLNLVLNADTTIKAVFQQKFTVASVVSGQGQVILNPPAGQVDAGTILTATAVPSPGWRFVGWSGDGSGTVSPLSLVVNADMTIIAKFKPEWQLTLSVSGSGSTAATPTPGPYLEGTSVTLTATPGPDSIFTGWSGTLSATSNPLTVVMSKNFQLTATFAPTYPVTLSASGSGTVVLQPQKARYALNEVVTAIATPAAGWSFAGWSGDLTSSSGSFAFPVTRSTALVATFQPLRTLTLQQDGQGTVTPGPVGPYITGTKVSVTAAPAVGWTFVGWQGGASGAANPLLVTLNADTTIKAVFKPLWPLIARVTGSGTVTAVPTATSYLDGTPVVLTANPAANWVFAGWTGSTVSSANPLSLTVSSAVDVTALFLPTYVLTTTVSGQGTIAVAPKQTRYLSNDLVTLTATPADGWDFTGWSGAASGTVASIQVRMTQDLSVTATFTAQPPPMDLSGTAVDGYLAGARVFFDANRNGILDPDEPSTTTDRAGKFTLTVDVKKFDRNHDGKLTSDEGRIVVDGGVDLSTGETRTGQLTAPLGASVVTPLTTLVDAVAGSNPSFGVDESERRVKLALGVPADVSVNGFDPIHAAAIGDPRAASVQAATATVSDTVSQLSTVLDRGSGADGQQAADAVGDALARQASAGVPLNLNQGQGVAGLLAEAAKSVGATFTVATASVVSDVIAAQNDAKTTAANTATDPVAALQQIGKVQAVSQGAAQTALGSLASGDVGGDEVRLSFTGVALTAAVQAAPIGDLFATNRAIGTFSLLDVNALATEDGRVVQPLTVVRRDGSAGAVRLEVRIDGGTALRTNKVVIDFADGELFQSVDLRALIIDNTVPDPERHLPVTLALSSSAPAGSKLADPLTGILTIVDNDAAGSVGFGASAYEVNEDGTAVNPVTLERRGGSAGTVVVEVVPSVLAGGGAVAGTDFVTTPISVTFGPGELRRTLTIPVIDDTVVEGTERFQFNLRLGAGSAAGSAVDTAASNAVITIIDNDGLATLSVTRNAQGAPRFLIRGPIRGRHTLQKSSNLKDWFNVGDTVLTQGTDTPVELSVPATAGTQFVRTVPAP